jgi:hypothetical protein
VLALPWFPKKGNRLLPIIENMHNTTARLKPVPRFGPVITRFGMVITHSGNVITRFGNAEERSPSTEMRDHLRPETAITFDRNC